MTYHVGAKITDIWRPTVLAVCLFGLASYWLLKKNSGVAIPCLTAQLEQKKLLLDQQLLELRRELQQGPTSDSLDNSEAEMIFACDRIALEDEEEVLTAQIALLDQLLVTDPAVTHTPAALENALRTLIEKLDATSAHLAHLPYFDDEEESSIAPSELALFRERRALETQEYALENQIDLIAPLLHISSHRVYEVKMAIHSHYLDAEVRRETKKEEIAAYYPLFQEWWMQGKCQLQDLSVPPGASLWWKEWATRY